MHVVCTSPHTHIVAKCASNSGSDCATVPTLGLVLSPRRRVCVSKDIHNLQHDQADRETDRRTDERTERQTGGRTGSSILIEALINFCCEKSTYGVSEARAAKCYMNLGVAHTSLALCLALQHYLLLPLCFTDKGLNWQLAISGYYSVLGA